MYVQFLRPDDLAASIADGHFYPGDAVFFLGLLSRLLGALADAAHTLSLLVRVRKVVAAGHESDHYAVGLVFRPELAGAGETG